MAERMSASLTVRTSTPWDSATPTVTAPGSRLPASPSATVGSTSMGTMPPAASAVLMEGDASDSTPTTRTPVPSRPMVTPASSPPPPQGTTTVPRLGTCSTSSRASVAWPAMTSGSL